MRLYMKTVASSSAGMGAMLGTAAGVAVYWGIPNLLKRDGDA